MGLTDKNYQVHGKKELTKDQKHRNLDINIEAADIRKASSLTFKIISFQTEVGHAQLA